ncbi:MAG: arylsulfatase [Actinomycetota bacterium]|nr:arylsulfatase [Actinomycetota bacterium]
MVVLDDTGFAHLGCYGSTLRTPHIDRLAHSGLRFNSFHTTALCSPTRACLLTGRNHHSVGMRGVSNWNTGYPNMTGGIAPEAGTIAEILREKGYATYAVGKWHLAPMSETSAAGPHDNWPLQKGFDRYYGFLQGETDQFHPELTHDNHHVDPPNVPGRDYHVSEDIVDHSISWIHDLISIRPDRPFFLYLAFGAMHSPHQSPLEYRQRWRGAFDSGYDDTRTEWFIRQLEMGIVPPDTQLAPRNPGVIPWDELTSAQQRFAAKLQEAFAAMLEHTDEQIGRLITFLEDSGLRENTLIVLLSDNGASQEGGPYGVRDEFSFFNAIPEDIEAIVDNDLDDIGGPSSHSNIPWGWAQAGNTPLKWYKQNTHGGGVRDPLIVSWSGHISDPGAIRTQFCHAVDIAPTILDALGYEAPVMLAGRPQLPIHGRSLLPIIENSSAPPARSVQYFEQVGHRGLWKDGFKAVTHHRSGTDFDEDQWELYDLSTDFSECNDLAEQLPAKLCELVETWWAEAGEKGVLPLDDRGIELFGLGPRPPSPHGPDTWVFYPPLSHIPSDVSPALGGRSWLITADIIVDNQSPQGVIYARGSTNVGQVFFVDDGELIFAYNALGHITRVSAPLTLTQGRHVLSARLRRAGQGGVLTIAVDDRDLASAEVPRIVRMLGSIGTDIGLDRLSPIVGDYQAPFPFQCELRKVTVRSFGRESQEDLTALAHAEFTRE